MRRLRRRALLLLLALGAAGLGYLGLSVGDGRADIAGPAQVVDGDTLTVAGQRIRLEGVDAPEAGQMCERDGAPWACGRDVTLALRLRLQGRGVRCAVSGRDRYDRAIARCRIGEEDVGAWLVREGLAVAYTRFTWRYLPQEVAARWDGRGLWAGRFDTPEEWRRRNQR